MYVVYILECADGSLYTGITTDVVRRLSEHQAGKGGHYTKAHGVVRVAYTEEHPNRSTASKREAEIKSWKREKKLECLCGLVKRRKSPQDRSSSILRMYGKIPL